MSKVSDFTILSNNKLAKDIFEIKLIGDTTDIIKPGQFVNIKIDDFFLRRPISVCDINGDELTLIYKVVGNGTAVMASYNKGDSLNLLTGLGNGFNTDIRKSLPLVVGGGVGIPPMYWLTKILLEKGFSPAVVLGFNDKDGAFYIDKFEGLGVKIFIATLDGSIGTKGFVTDAVSKNNIKYDYTFSCGPMPMLKAIYDISNSKGQFSFEEKMACGFGACMGCSCKTKYGNKRICKDGPILFAEEIIW